MVTFEGSPLAIGPMATQALDGLVGILLCQQCVIKPSHACQPPGIML